MSESLPNREPDPKLTDAERSVWNDIAERLPESSSLDFYDDMGILSAAEQRELDIKNKQELLKASKYIEIAEPTRRMFTKLTFEFEHNQDTEKPFLNAELVPRNPEEFTIPRHHSVRMYVIDTSLEELKRALPEHRLIEFRAASLGGVTLSAAHNGLVRFGCNALIATVMYQDITKSVYENATSEQLKILQQRGEIEFVNGFYGVRRTGEAIELPPILGVEESIVGQNDKQPIPWLRPGSLSF